jgi:O-antigen biosynthesis protein
MSKITALGRAFALIPYIWKLRVKTPIRFIRNYFSIKRSTLFDAEFYAAEYPDPRGNGLDLLAHYTAVGGIEDRNPNPLFNSVYYRQKYAEDVSVKVHPLVHYIRTGVYKGYKPHPLFDTAYYRKEYPDIAEAGINPLAHFLYYGGQEGRNPHPLFDSRYYLLQAPECKKAGVNPLVHFLENKAGSLLKPHPLFFPGYYTETYPDVAESKLNPLVHFVEHGWKEYRNPNPLFNTRYYLENSPEAAESGTNPLVHYISIGAAQKRDPHPLFSAEYYTEIYPDVMERDINPLSHFLENGITEGRVPINFYGQWLASNKLTSKQHKNMDYTPCISVLIPVYNTEEQFLRRCIESVIDQVYPNWELCIADDASTLPHVRELLTGYTKKDPRIRVVFREKNGHISAASNDALQIADGEYIALLDHDDELPVHALYENVLLLNEHPDADMVYSDEDKITESGIRHMPFFKPDWSPDTLLSQMYTGHLGVYRTELIRQIGGFRIGFEGSQDYDLALRVSEQTEKIYHIPKILYHWRTVPGSTAKTSESKQYAYNAAKKALQESLNRRGERGVAEFIPGFRGQYRVRYPIQEKPKISIIIPTKDNSAVVEKCLFSIFTRTVYPSFEVVIIDNGSTEQGMSDLVIRWSASEGNRFKAVFSAAAFNFSRLINEGVHHASGEILMFLNDDTEVISPEWLGDMAGYARRETIGAVGPVLLYPDNTIQHAGVILGIGGVAGHSHKYEPGDSPGYFGRLKISANYAAVTGACMMVMKERYLEVGGFDEELAVAYNDVDFCLRLMQQGYNNVVLSDVRLYHIESQSRGKDTETDEKWERLKHDTTIMRERWSDYIANDPFYNPNLTKKSEDFSLSIMDSYRPVRKEILKERLTEQK